VDWERTGTRAVVRRHDGDGEWHVVRRWGCRAGLGMGAEARARDLRGRGIGARAAGTGHRRARRRAARGCKGTRGAAGLRARGWWRLLRRGVRVGWKVL
jgi:hypothetical protein